MPRYTVTDPGSGRTLTLEGDSPPTEQELEQIFSTVGTGTSRPTAGLESVAAEQGRIAGQALDLLNVGLETGRQQRQREAEQNLPPLPPEPISRTPPGVSTIAGGPQLRIAGAPGTGANLGQQIAEAAAEPLLQLPRLAPSMEQFRKLTRDPFTPEEEVATADLLKQPAALPEQAVVGAMSGVDELIRGVAGFLSSPSGIAQVSAMKTPLAPAVALKWAKDMVEGGMISAGEALDAYRRGDMEAFARHVTFGTGMILGAGGIVKHGVGTAESAAAGFAPRGQGIASPELKTFAPVTAQAVSETIKPSEVTSADTIPKTMEVAGDTRAASAAQVAEGKPPEVQQIAATLTPETDKAVAETPSTPSAQPPSEPVAAAEAPTKVGEQTPPPPTVPAKPEGGPVELVGTKFSKYSNALVSKDPSSGKWRLTWFNQFSGTGELTPFGHKEYASRKAALAAAKRLEYVEKPSEAVVPEAPPPQPPRAANAPPPEPPEAPAPPRPEAGRAVPGEVKPYSKEAVQSAFNLTPEQAEATDAIVKAMGLDENRIEVAKGGTAAEGALKQPESEGSFAPDEDMHFAYALDAQKLNGPIMEKFLDLLQKRNAPLGLQKYFSDLLDWHRVRDALRDLEDSTQPQLASIQMEIFRKLKRGDSENLREFGDRIKAQPEYRRIYDPYLAKREMLEGLQRDITERFSGDDSPGYATSMYDLLYIVEQAGDSPALNSPNQTRLANELGAEWQSVKHLMRKPRPIQPLFQGDKGAAEFSTDGKAIIRGFASADVSTGIHEIAHVARRQLFDRNLKPEQRAGITDQDISHTETWAGAQDGVWDRPAEEKFARGFERYLRDGRAPTEHLRNIFDKFKEWLTGIYRRLTGSEINVKISPEMRGVFDRLVTRSERLREPQPSEPAQKQPQPPPAPSTAAAGEGEGKAKLPTPEQAPLAYPDRKFSRERSIDRDEFVKKNIPQDQWQNTDTVGPPGEILWETKRGIDTWGKSFENPISSAVFTTKDGRVVALDPKNPELIRVLDPKDPRITWNKALVEKYGIELKPTPAAPAELPGGGKEAPISEGPGAASPGDVPKKSQIEQLGSAFKGGSTQRQTLREKVKEIFDLKNQKEITKDLLARTLSSLKTAGDYLINTWKGQTDLDPILKSKGLLSAELEMRGWRMRQAAKDMKRAVPDRRVREAISKYVDAGGDMAKLQEAAGTVPEGRRAPYERAMNLTPEEKIFAGHIRSFFESRLQEAIDAGVLRQGIEDYIHRIYPRETAWKKGTINAVQNGVLDTRKPSLAMQRVFELDAEAERAGYYPVNDFIPRILDYEASLSKVIASRAAVKRFTEIDMPDGRKMLETSGLGIPIDNPEGVREATLIRPGGRPANLDLTGYQSRDYPALKKWKWASTDADGKPIFVEGNVLIHPDAVHRIDALLEPSKIRKYAAGRTALNVGSVFKQTMLDFSGFHQVQIAIHALEHNVNPFNLLKEIDFENRDVQGLLKGGMTLGGQHTTGVVREGLVGRSLSRQIPGIGELMRTYHDWLFQDFIPRVKATMALHALTRNRKRFSKDLASGKMTEDALYHQTAKEANAAFGELNYIMLERSKTVQDLARLTLLAPDFLEARGRFVLQAGTRLGGEQRMALFLGALTLYTVARVMNKTLDDQWHFEPENAFSIIHNGKAYSIRTVQGDVLHALEEPVRFWLHRLNPTITRPLFQLMTGRDEFGRKRDFWQTLGDTISNLIPISMRSSREQKLWTSLLNAFGGSVRRYSELQHVYQKAREWNQQHGVRQEPGEFIYDASKDTYRPLKLAIMDGDIQAAAVEYRKLIDSKAVTPEQARKHFSDYGSKPFTGSSAREGPFKASLSDDEKRAYEGAKQERQRIVRGFYKAVAESSAPPVNK